MQPGADIGEVFSRLARAASEIEKVAKFSHDANLGYITSCPTNLGTALRASVHIQLPNLGARMDEFKAIADKFYVQIRGIHGEHSESSDHTYDISNRRRLGRSEVALVQDMYDGVKAMIDRENELAGGAEESKGEDIEAGTHLKSPNDITGFPVFPAGTKSLLSKNLTRTVWDALKDEKDAQGVSFKQAILSGCQNIDSGIGVYAGSHDSYTSFSALFDPIIEQYHGHKKGDKHVSNMDASKLVCPPFPAEDAAMIVSTRIRVGRNLAGVPLGPGISKEQRDDVEKKVVEACGKFDGELAGKYYSLATMTEADQEQLIADHFLFKEGDRFLEACGLNRDWPSGRGIFHNNEKTFLVWVNEEDQLRIISMQQGADIGAVFTRLATAAAEIEKVAQFSHDESLGYITSCPTNLGTALRASVHIKLPNLGEKMDEFKAIADKFYVQIRGIHGEHSESADHIYDISNRRRLGRSEVDLVQDMYDGVQAMIAREKELAASK
jgi:protein-arginine kinase